MNNDKDLQQEADKSSNSQTSVFRVVGLVFLVVFVLLIFSFLMEMRSRTTQLHDSVSSLETVIEERQALRDELASVEAENDALRDEVEALRVYTAKLEGQLEALREAMNPEAEDGENTEAES